MSKILSQLLCEDQMKMVAKMFSEMMLNCDSKPPKSNKPNGRFLQI